MSTNSLTTQIHPQAGQALVLRAAEAGDREALARLAGRDTALPADGELLLAERGGELRAALELETGRVIADPFHPTAELVELLRARAAQLRASRRRPLRVLARTPAPRPGRAALRERAA